MLSEFSFPHCRRRMPPTANLGGGFVCTNRARIGVETASHSSAARTDGGGVCDAVERTGVRLRTRPHARGGWGVD